MKILINRSHGCIRLTGAVYRELGLPWTEQRKGWGFDEDQIDPKNADFGIVSSDPDAWRYDPLLIAAVEKLGLEESGGRDVELLIVEIPDGIEWEIWDYDGKESVHEKHRHWPGEKDL